MNGPDLYADIGYASLNHAGEQLCGDHLKYLDQGARGDLVVLADGLGSGVKACILSTLTSTIISTMMANGMSLDECVKSVANTLPVCSERKVAYSTFTILRIADQTAELIQYDNPYAIFLRGGKSLKYQRRRLNLEWKGVYHSTIPIKADDVFVLFSDGVLNASRGEELDLSWNLPAIASFMEMVYDPKLSAKSLCQMLLSACDNMYGGEPGDDVTVCVVKLRRRQRVNLLMGPPEDPGDLETMLTAFFAQEGKRIVSGGTTSHLAAEFLQVKLDERIPVGYRGDLPPIAAIPGVDLTTEGALTMARVLEYAKDAVGEDLRRDEWSFQKDGASRIARMLFEDASDVAFYVGRSMNPAHQNPALPAELNLRVRIIEELSACLRQMGKRVEAIYF